MPEHLDDAARRVLLMLWNKGPAMPVELAAQCYSFPDEVAPTLKSLEQAGLVEMRPVTWKGVGGELVCLSNQGRQWVRRDLLSEGFSGSRGPVAGGSS